MYISVFQEIVFIEGTHPEATPLGPVNVSIKGALTHSQLKSLDDVKLKMVNAARQLGANAIVQFKYGQKSPSFLGSFFNLDDVNWYGTGTAAKLPEQIYRQIVDSNLRPSS